MATIKYHGSRFAAKIRSCMRKLAPTEIARLSAAELETTAPHPIAVILDNVRSLYNVGSIFRTSDAARIQRLYLTGITGTPTNRKLHKTALGAQDSVPWAYEKDALTLARRLKANGYHLAVLEITDSPTEINDLPAGAFPLCLVVGNEVTGVSDALVEMADAAIEIPQYGFKHSLNVAVAYGVAIFDLVRHYHGQLCDSSQDGH